MVIRHFWCWLYRVAPQCSFLLQWAVLDFKRWQWAQRALLPQFQFKIVSNPKQPGTFVECVPYCEHGSKNWPGSTAESFDNKHLQHTLLIRHLVLDTMFSFSRHTSQNCLWPFKEDSFSLKPRCSKHSKMTVSSSLNARLSVTTSWLGCWRVCFALLALMILTKVIGNHLNVLPKLHSFIPIFLTC